LSGWFKIYKYEKSNYIIITVIRLAHKCKPSRETGCKRSSGFKSPRRRNRYILSSDFGIGENMSLGLTANYLLSVNEDALGNIPDFGQRVDLKARFNANLGMY
jgi:hypothetical protein